MKRDSKGRNQLTFYLPDEIILKILLLLPFDSILACKRLSKQWKNLINDPNFAKRYHHNGSMIVLLYASQLFCVLVRHINEVTQYPSYTVHPIPIKLNRHNFQPSNGTRTGRKIFTHELLSGWSDGIACVKQSNGYFVLYNLFTGSSHTVEDTPLQTHSEYWMYHGFGYDRFDDDYKIMVVCDYEAWTRDWLMRSEGERFDSDNVRNKENSLFWVYSFGNHSWKSYDGFPYAAYVWPGTSRGGAYPFNGVLLYAALIWPWSSRGGAYSFNGVLHYAVEKRGGKRVIVTYDLHTRRFGEILVPVGDMDCHGAKVTELDGRLCYGYKLPGKWVIEVHGVGGSWTKLVIIDHSVTPDFSYTALYEWGDGRKVGLLVCGWKLKWYDFSKNEIEEVDIIDTFLMKRMQQSLMNQRDIGNE